MVLPARVRPEAEHDLAQARDWYESQQAGLGRRFLEEFAATLARIGRYPAGYSVVRGPVRRATLRHFPFGVFYIPTDHEIRVLAVIHLARHPVRWRSWG